jgi:hypothetical protein
MLFVSLHAWASSIIVGTTTVNCSTTGVVALSGCYSESAFSANDNLDFYHEFGSALRNSGGTGVNANPTNVQGTSLNGYTTNGNLVEVSLGPNGTTIAMAGPLAGLLGSSAAVPSPNDTTYIGRMDNAFYTYIPPPPRSQFGGWGVPTGDNGEPYYLYAGQFAAPSAPVGYGTSEDAEQHGGLGAYLLGPVLQDGDGADGQMVFTFNTPVQGVGFEISSRSTAFGTPFQAELDAYDVTGALIGSYFISTNGGGGLCYGLLNFSGSPQPCNANVPFIGITEATPEIKKVVIDAVDSHSPLAGFFLADMMVEEASTGAPEPASIFLTGFGLLGALLYSRKRRIKSRA